MKLKRVLTSFKKARIHVVNGDLGVGGVGGVGNIMW